MRQRSGATADVQRLVVLVSRANRVRPRQLRVCGRLVFARVQQRQHVHRHLRAVVQRRVRRVVDVRPHGGRERQRVVCRRIDMHDPLHGIVFDVVRG
jgi:hypothetical protein